MTDARKLFEVTQSRNRIRLLISFSFILGLVSFSSRAQQREHPVERAKGAVADWHFEDAPRGSALEVLSGRHDPITGITQITAGPVGPALKMDGYTTAIQSLPIDQIAHGLNFAVSCWLKVDAYPWNELPIVDQRVSDHQFLFGIDASGHLIATISTFRGEERTTTIESVPLRRWLLLTLGVDKDGKITMTENGRVSHLKIDLISVTSQVHKRPPGAGLLIGHVRDPLLPGPPEVIHPQFSVEYSLEGSLGSLTVYDHALDQTEVNALYGSGQPHGDLERETPAPTFPKAESQTGDFGAFYTSLKYEPTWDRTRRSEGDSDVVVRFAGSAIRLVFWQGTNYVPAWVTENNRWYSDEFMEVYGSPRCPYGEDCEPMSDKQTRYSQVKILENTPARVVIHWRYALSEVERYAVADAESPTAWGDWGDEYWTVFPDGVAVRRQILWSSASEREKTEFQESIVLVPAGEKPEDGINFDALTYVNLKGEQHTYSWRPKTGTAPTYPQVSDHFNEPANAVIQRVNLKSAWTPFEVAPGDLVTFDSYTREKSLSAFEWWNHWPVAQIPSSGRPAQAADRPGHTSLSHIYWPFYDKKDASLEKILMTGLTNKTAEELIPLALSWRQPAAAEVTGGAKIRYDASQRAYIITDTPSGPFTVTLHGSRINPVLNLSLVVEAIKGHESVSVEAAGRQYQIATGEVEELTQHKLLAFVTLASEDDVRITFERTR